LGYGQDAQGDIVLQRHRRFFAGLAGIVVLLAAATFRLSPLWPGPGLPPGATRLHIATEPAHLVPTLGCPTAALAPARIATAGDELVVLSVDGNEPANVVWPSGWAAWRIDGHAQLVTRDGTIVGNEGDILPGFGGGSGVDDAFHVCVIGS
jgi:hypothetical protein